MVFRTSQSLPGTGAHSYTLISSRENSARFRQLMKITLRLFHSIRYSLLLDAQRQQWMTSLPDTLIPVWQWESILMRKELESCLESYENLLQWKYHFLVHVLWLNCNSILWLLCSTLGRHFIQFCSISILTNYSVTPTLLVKISPNVILLGDHIRN